jgi:hypothetical protein
MFDSKTVKMKTKIFLLSLLTLPLLLAGCVASSPLTQDPAQTPAQTSTSEPSLTASPSETASEPETDSEAGVLMEAEVYEVVERSYLLFEERGMTERVISEGEEFVLLFDPEQPDYQAAWFNLDTGERELIFETDYFTLFVAYLMLDVPGHEIEIAPGGFVLSAPEWNPIEYSVKDGLLTGAKGVEFDWDATFDYSVDSELVVGLEALAAELLESFEE